MRGGKMGLVTLVYIIFAALLLWFLSEHIPAETLLSALLPLALGLMVLWVVLIFVVMKLEGRKKK